MGLFDRIMRVVRANLNSLVNQAEDPEKMLEQIVSDMQEDLIHMRQAVAQAIATQKRTERQQSQASATAEEWYRRAQLALQKGDDTLAREALTRRQAYKQTADSLQAQLGQQVGVIDKLKKDMLALESKISEAKTKKDMYIARARSAKASERLNELMDRTNTAGSMAAFERMEEKVLQLEARSEAIAELGTDDIDKRFAALEGGNSVEDELQSMKSQILSGQGSAGTLPAASDSTKAAVDREFEDLRSQIEGA